MQGGKEKIHTCAGRGNRIKAAVDGQKKENGVALYYGGYMEEQSMISYV